MVPKSRQTESVSTECLHQPRIVWRELISIAKRLLESRIIEFFYIFIASFLYTRDGAIKQNGSKWSRRGFSFPCRLRFLMPVVAMAF